MQLTNSFNRVIFIENTVDPDQLASLEAVKC